MSTQNALKLLFELRVVLDRLGENDSTIHEAMAHDVDEAIRLTEGCVAELTLDGEGEEERQRAGEAESEQAL